MDEYYLASLKLGGWMSKSGIYTSDIAQARRFDLAEALVMARRQTLGNNPVVPVKVEHMGMIV